ncbi:MAG: hypothetical protein IPQ23_19150 [Cytophagaceae bacterium]|nr:hypothetical protein [Cytophagaceae bacterium]
MKNIIKILTLFALTSCGTNYPMTTFYVKNQSNKTINFKASVIKLSSLGQQLVTVPFTVLPKDSVLARQVGLKIDAKPTAWFHEFIIFPVDSLQTNDPKLAENWIKSINKAGRTIYTFNLTK